MYTKGTVNFIKSQTSMITETNKGVENMTPEQFDKHHNMKVATDVLIYTVREQTAAKPGKVPEKKLQLLMIKRKNDPFKGQWAIPGGAVENNEDVDTAAYRELKEETNVDNVYIEQLYTWGKSDRDPRAKQAPQNWSVSVSYIALVDSTKLNIQAGDDAADAKWFNVECDIKENILQRDEVIYGKEFLCELTLSHQEHGENIVCTATVVVKNTVDGTIVNTEREVLNSQGIAFDHAQIIQYSLERLKNKAEYTNMALNLMPEFFTLAELQAVYEVLLGQELLAPNFRKKVLDIDKLVVATNKLKTEGLDCPSELYKFNNNWLLTNL